MNTLRNNSFICLLLFLTAIAGPGCTPGRSEAQKPARSESVKTDPAASATPYQPPKRVSRDVISSDKKEEPAKTRTKKK